MATSTTSKKPTAKDRLAAKQSVELLKDITDKATNKEELTFHIEGTNIKLPHHAIRLLEKVLEEMADGKSVAITSFAEELSTQEAADLLNVSRPHLVKLLESGKIPFKKVGAHRRVKLEDIKKYETALKETRRKALEEITKEAQEMNMGY